MRAALLIHFTAAVVTDVVYVDNTGGMVECLGGPEWSKMAYNKEGIPTNSVLCMASINCVGSSRSLSENTSFTLHIHHTG